MSQKTVSNSQRVISHTKSKLIGPNATLTVVKMFFLMSSQFNLLFLESAIAARKACFQFSAAVSFALTETYTRSHIRALPLNTGNYESSERGMGIQFVRV